MTVESVKEASRRQEVRFEIQQHRQAVLLWLGKESGPQEQSTISLGERKQ